MQIHLKIEFVGFQSNFTSYKISCTSPLLYPASKRLQSLLKAKAETEPYFSPYSVEPKHHFKTCWGSVKSKISHIECWRKNIYKSN